MRKHGILIITLGFALICNAQIKEIKECKFTPKIKKNKAKLITESKATYTTNSKIITLNRFTLNNGLLIAFDSSKYLYDRTGKLVESKLYTLKNDNFLKQKIEYKYDSILLKEKIVTDLMNDENSGFIEYFYNKYNQKVKEVEYSVNYTMINTLFYNIVYDELGRVTYTRNTNIDTIFNMEECEYTYEDGIKTVKNCDSHFSKKWSEFFDKNGNLIEKRYYEADPTDTLWMEQWEYYENNNLKKNYLYNPYQGEKILKKYNKNGLIESNVNKDFGDNVISTITYKYKYDRNNNWVKKTKYLNNKKKEVTLREIKYY